MSNFSVFRDEDGDPELIYDWENLTIKDAKGNPRGTMIKDGEDYILRDEHGDPKGRMSRSRGRQINEKGDVERIITKDGKFIETNDSSQMAGPEGYMDFPENGTAVKSIIKKVTKQPYHYYESESEEDETLLQNQGIQQTVKEVKPFQPYKFTENSLKTFKGLVGRITRVETPSYERTTLGSALQSLKQIEYRVSPDPKDYTRKESRYDKYSDFDMGLETGVESILNNIVQRPLSERIREINEFEQNGNKSQSDIVKINTWLNVMVNTMYYEYYSRNNLPMPTERIYLPEHVVNEIFLTNNKDYSMTKDYAILQEDIMNIINRTLNSYIDNDGKVYHNSLEKYISPSRRDMDEALKKYEEDPSADKEEPFVKLLPKHKASLDFDFNAMGRVAKGNIVDLMVAACLFDGLMPEECKDNMSCNVEFINKKEKSDTFNSYYDADRDKIVINTKKDIKPVNYIRTFVNELVCKNDEVNKKAYDFVYENTKGNPIEPLGKYEEGFNDRLNTKGEIVEKDKDQEMVILWAYQTLIYDQSFERYMKPSTLFSGAFNMLTANIDVNCNRKEMFRLLMAGSNEKTFYNMFGLFAPYAPKNGNEEAKHENEHDAPKNGNEEAKHENEHVELNKEIDHLNDKIRTIIAGRLRVMYEMFPDMACMTLALMRGDLNKK